MKKILAIFVILCIIFATLCSCKKENNECQCPCHDEKSNECEIFIDGENASWSFAVPAVKVGNTYHIPILGILRYLGATIYCEGNDRIFAVYNNKTVISFDLTAEDFGHPIPPGTEHGVRTGSKGELILDYETVSIILEGVMGIERIVAIGNRIIVMTK